MMRFFIALLLAVSFTSCDKLIEEAAEDAIIDAMTSGKWMVTSYVRGGNDITGDFNGYTFQFHRNETVDAIKNTTVEKSGTWQGDGNARTINAQFANAAEPVSLLNGNWQVTNNSWDFVVATLTVAGEVRTLRLQKI